jgi:DNA mismatch endonuclease (patch repair protein)
MADTLTQTQRSERMSLVKGKDTKPERIVRQLAHSLGFRFRLHRRDLPGRPDLAFPKYKAAIFVHGCFWHRHPDKDCKLARMPKSRLDFWTNKLEGNRARDLRKQEELANQGWRVLVIWECELKDDEGLARKLRSFLSGEI